MENKIVLYILLNKAIAVLLVHTFLFFTLSQVFSRQGSNMTANKKEFLKVVVIGDSYAGKSCLIETCMYGRFPEYIVGAPHTPSKCVMIEGKIVEVYMWDTAGQDDYDRLRPLSYPGTDIFLICFDLAKPASFENIKIKWIPEITRWEPDAKFMIIGCKDDLGNSIYKPNDILMFVSAYSRFQCDKVYPMEILQIIAKHLEYIMVATDYNLSAQRLCDQYKSGYKYIATSAMKLQGTKKLLVEMIPNCYLYDGTPQQLTKCSNCCII